MIAFPVTRHRLWQLVADGVLIAAAWWIAFFLCFDQDVPFYYRNFLSWGVFAVVIVIQLGVFASSASTTAGGATSRPATCGGPSRA